MFRKYYSAILSASLLLSALTACGTQAAPSAASSASTIAQQTNESQLLVTDIKGNSRDLAQLPWAKKYPSMLKHYEGQTSENLTDFIFPTMAQENLIAKGAAMDIPFRDGSLRVTMQEAVKGPEPSGISAEKVAQGEQALGTLPEGEEYLTVTLSIENTGSSEADFYLNNISIRCCVDGTVAQGHIGSEAVTSDLPAVAENAKNQFEALLAPGEKASYKILYYVNSEIELQDLYLYPNLAGEGVAEVTTADFALDQQWLALE